MRGEVCVRGGREGMSDKEGQTSDWTEHGTCRADIPQTDTSTHTTHACKVHVHTSERITYVIHTYTSRANTKTGYVQLACFTYATLNVYTNTYSHTYTLNYVIIVICSSPETEMTVVAAIVSPSPFAALSRSPITTETLTS